MAEPGADARRRAAVADQPGARGLGDPFARQAGEFPRQPDRGLRPAMEAPARRHRRRLLGTARFRAARIEIPAGRGHQ